MSLAVITPPTQEILTLTEIKDHLDLEGNDHDDLVEGQAIASREYLERILNRTLSTATTYKLVLDGFPVNNFPINGPVYKHISLPRPPVQSVASVKYIDTNGTQQTLDSSLYQVDLVSEPARIFMLNGNIWPDTTNQLATVEVVYTAGYSTPPEAIKHAIKLMLGTWFETRQGEVEQKVHEFTFGIDTLISAFRVY